ncbi:hypothetical protein [Microbacterium hydrocarbonoxydans]
MPSVVQLHSRSCRLRTLMGVTVLGYPDQLVEIEAIAAIEEISA